MIPLARRIVACRRCPRLVAHRREVARTRRRAFRDETYWGRPVPSFGVECPRLLVVGLAPGAHGANRTGRVFTGDDSGRWLYRALHAEGFASEPVSERRDDGLELRDTVVSCAVRCAPPQNRPTAAERDVCLPFLVEELASYADLRVVVALGRFAFDALRKAWPLAELPPWERAPAFSHGSEVSTEGGGIVLIASYHPSRQNTQTGRLTRDMFQRPFRRARSLLEES